MNDELAYYGHARHEGADWTRIKRITAPSAAIISAAEARAHLRLSHTDDDSYIAGLIATATAFIEGPNGIGIALISQQYRLSMDNLPRRFFIPLGPVISVDSIVVAGDTIDPATYTVDLDANPCRVVRSQSTAQICNQTGTVKVTFTAGFGTTSADVPADLRHAALLLIGHFYENREATRDGGTTMEITEVPFAVKAILDRYRA